MPVRLVLLTTAVLTLAACGGSADPAAEESARASGPIEIVTSTDVYGAVVQAVGGDRVNVTSFIDNPGVDPEEYESTPADAAAVARARLVVGNGGGYDDFVFQLVEAAGGERAVLNVAELSGLEEQVPAGEEFNEHVWFDLATVQDLADQVASELARVSPEDAEAFKANAAAFRKEVDGLRDVASQIRAEHAGTRIAATEPLPLYLLDDAGLQNAAPQEFMEASEEGTDAPAAVVQETLELVTGPDPVRVLVLNVQTQTPATDRLRQSAQSAGIPEVAVNETLSEGYEDYVLWIGAQLDALAAALEQSA